MTMFFEVILFKKYSSLLHILYKIIWYFILCKLNHYICDVLKK